MATPGASLYTMIGEPKRWANGNCIDMPIEEIDDVFFPTRGRPRKEPAHVHYCESCPILNFCLSYALIYREYGVWGGMTENDRKTLLKSNPNLQDGLIKEAKNQGWYRPRKTVEEILRDLFEDYSLEEPEPDPWEEPEGIQFEVLQEFDLQDTTAELPLLQPVEQSAEAVPVEKPIDLFYYPSEPEFALG